MEEDAKQTEKGENYTLVQNTKDKGETMINEPELEMDQEMTQSETNMEDHELQESLDKEHLDLEGFLQQGTTAGIYSLPQDECNIKRQLFLWKTQENGADRGKNINV